MKLQLILLDDLFYRGTGPTGPRGETISQTNTYGRKYDTTQTGITLEANISQDIPLGSNGPANGITLETQNKLTIPTTGVYKVDYYFQVVQVSIPRLQ